MRAGRGELIGVAIEEAEPSVTRGLGFSVLEGACAGKRLLDGHPGFGAFSRTVVERCEVHERGDLALLVPNASRYVQREVVEPASLVHPPMLTFQKREAVQRHRLALHIANTSLEVQREVGELSRFVHPPL